MSVINPRSTSNHLPETAIIPYRARPEHPGENLSVREMGWKSWIYIIESEETSRAIPYCQSEKFMPNGKDDD